jgi:hypothetical protein
VKVTARTSTALVIRDTATTLRLVGAFFLLFGALFIGVASQGATSLWEHAVPAIVGILFALIGLLLVLLPGTQTFVFDKGERSLFIIREGVFRRPVRESVRLTDITGVDLERSGDAEGDGLFRVALVLADGKRRPWTGYYRSGGAQLRAIVDIVRGFLQLEAPAQTNTGIRLVAVLTAAQRRSTGWLLTAGIAMCLIFLVIGARLLWVQESQLARYVPIAMTVDATRMAVIPDKEGENSFFQPVIEYHFEHGGRRYSGSRVTPLNATGARRWAEQTLAQYAVGRTYVGYHDPQRPGSAFLARERSALPYLFMSIPIFGLAVFGVGLSGLRKPVAT